MRVQYGLVIAGWLLSATVLAAEPLAIEAIWVQGKDPILGGQSSAQFTINTDSLLVGTRQDAAELFNLLPGVQADSRSNYAQDTRLTHRGFGARSAFGVRGLMLQVDGIPLSTADGQGQFSAVQLDDVAKVELLSGPMAVLYGNGAGGVITLHTRAPTQNAWGAAYIAGADGLIRRRVDGALVGDQFSFALAAADFETDGARPHSQAEREFYSLRSGYQFINGATLTFRVSKNHDPILQDPLGLTPEQWREDPLQKNPVATRFNPRKSIEHTQYSLSVIQDSGVLPWNFSAWRSERDMSQYLGFSGDAIAGAGGVVELNRESSGVNASVSIDGSLLAKPLTTRTGFEYSALTDQRRGFVNSGGEKGDLRRNEVGEATKKEAFVAWDWQLAKQVSFNYGVRVSNIQFAVDDYFIVEGNPDDSGKKSFENYAAAAELKWQMAIPIALYASAGRGFETPTLTESAYRIEGSGLNDALDVATHQQAELGAVYEVQRLSAKLAFFKINGHDEIMVQQSVGGRTFYHNAADTKRQGVEYSMTLQLNDSLTLLAATNWLEASFDGGAFVGNRLPGVATQNHSLLLNYRPRRPILIQLETLRRSSVMADDENSMQAPSSSLVNLGVEYVGRVGELEWSLWGKLHNLTNEAYVGSVIVNQSNRRAFESGAARNFAAGIALKQAF